MSHPPGTVIVAAGEFLRFGGFVHSLLKMERPEGTHIHIEQSVAICENLNGCIRRMADDSKWIWIQADDHIFPDGDELIRLLDREVDVVVPLMLRRSPPFVPVIYKDYLPGKGYKPFGYDELPREGLFEVYAAGTGGMLVRREILEKIGDPWFTYAEGEKLNEDLHFCQKVRKHSKIYCDVEVTFGHRGTFTAWPIFDDERWGVGLNMGSSSNGKSNTIVVHATDVREE